MEKIVISLGGSLLLNAEGRLSHAFVNRIVDAFHKAKSKRVQMVLVTGGGRKAREYAKAAREKTGSEFFADREAIVATRENARELIRMLGKDAHPHTITEFDMVNEALRAGKIPVAGGMLEGLTTDAVAVLIAEMVKANAVINLGDTDGVYTADPKKDKGAKRIPIMRHADLVKLAIKSDQRKAGTHFVFDLVASKLAARSNIELRFLDGRDLANVEKALMGRDFQGTIVRD
ncbi:MAG: UMP kinase [Candidatus Micrarchaeota archaeon]